MITPPTKLNIEDAEGRLEPEQKIQIQNNASKYTNFYKKYILLETQYLPDHLITNIRTKV